MKRICAALLLVVLMAGAAWAEGQMLNLTKDNVFAEFAKAAKDTDFLFDESSVKFTCDKTCVGNAVIGETTFFMPSYEPKTKHVGGVILMSQVADEDKAKVMQNIVNASECLNVALRVANPKISKEDRAKIHKRIGVVAKDFTDGKPRELKYRGVKFTARLMQGIYILTMDNEL